VKLQKLLRTQPSMEGGQFWQVTNTPTRLKVTDGITQHLYGTPRRSNQPGQYFDYRSLTGTVWPQETKGLSAVHDKTDIVYRDETTICLAQMFNVHSRNTTLNVVVFPVPG